jgi:RNA polymerase sigma-70 factor (ECF subfamily)
VLKAVEVKKAFARFVEEAEPRLLRALVGVYGPEVGREATSDAIAYAWEHWDRVSAMQNPIGYLYRVGQSRSRSYSPRRVSYPPVSSEALPEVDPRLPSAFQRLSEKQRTAVILLFVEEMSEREAANAMAVSRATVRQHAQRGLKKLRKALQVT